jgi:uncharacterized protein (AIM24 family)
MLFCSVFFVVFEIRQKPLDGNFTILRDSRIDFAVKKSTKSIIGTLASGEGLLNTFTGSGPVIIAPTAPVYRALRFGGMEGVNAAQGGSNHRE